MVRKIKPTKRDIDNWKDKIQASQIINGFVKHFNGEKELSASQIKVGEILLRKTIPDLARQELTGADNGPVQLTVKWKDAK
jgi:hypothetical protein